MRIVSLFDGLSGARVALSRLDIEPDVYLASEIDVYSIHCGHLHHPKTVYLGAVENLSIDGEVDLLIGGSPCQDLSRAGPRRAGLEGARSGLFYEYMRILIETQPKYFVLENVASMRTRDHKLITKEIGVEPILIDSALVSAQRRRRYYWTNIPGIEQPVDRNIMLRDILEDHPSPSFNHSIKAIAYMDRMDASGRTKWDYGYHSDSAKPKSATVTANYKKGVPNNVLADREHGVFRRFTPVECERLQGFPDGYTGNASDSRRYEMLGNAFQVDTIAHILSYMER